MLSNKEIDELQSKDYDERRPYAKKVKSTIEKFLDTKYKGLHCYTTSYKVFNYIMNRDTEFFDQSFQIKLDCQDVIRAMSEKSVQELDYINPASVVEKMIRIINFLDAIDEESSKAELFLAYIDEFGAEDIRQLSHIEKVYSDKTKISEYKKLNRLDPDTRNEMVA